MLWSGCGGQNTPAAPTSQYVVPEPPTNPPATACVFSPVTRPARVFAYLESPLPKVSAYTLCSRYVLYEDGTFELEFAGRALYRGTYVLTANTADFTWDAWSVAGTWTSSATLRSDRLTVKYGLIMQLDDFEDAIYQLRPEPR
jgi:hypothetical protein